MRDTLHCVHICWLTQLNQTSHQSMVFPGANHFKINFLFSILHCSPITVSPPHFFLSPPGFGQFHGQSSVSASPFFSDWLFSDYWFCSYSRAFPHAFYPAQFPKTLSSSLIHIDCFYFHLSVYLFCTQSEQSHDVFLRVIYDTVCTENLQFTSWQINTSICNILQYAGGVQQRVAREPVADGGMHWEHGDRIAMYQDRVSQLQREIPKVSI